MDFVETDIVWELKDAMMGTMKMMMDAQLTVKVWNKVIAVLITISIPLSIIPDGIRIRCLQQFARKHVEME